MEIIYLIIIVTIYILYSIDSIFLDEYNVEMDYTNEIVKEYIIPNITIQSSSIGGRGIFASQSYKKTDIIEICPCIQVNNNKIDGRLNDYAFEYDNTTSLIVFGYGSIYNHKNTPNAGYSILNKCQMEIYAIQDINIGEEIFIFYGIDYFKDRYHIDEKFE
jgi:SET domain-containing protein